MTGIFWGEMPPILAPRFETETATTPYLALKLYIVLAEDWAHNVLAYRDLSQSYPIRAEPTREHAEMLQSRAAFLRKKFMPLAKRLERGGRRFDWRRFFGP